MTAVSKPEYRTPSQVAKSGAHPAIVSPAPLVKTWTNVNHATNDIVKIVISMSGMSFKVDVFGACVPNPCSWGTVAAIPYAANVSSSPAVAFSAHYSFSFAQVILVGHLLGKEMILETFTQFTDGSGRSNLYTTDTMV